LRRGIDYYDSIFAREENKFQQHNMFLRPISGKDGSLFAFEVSNGYISFRRLCRCISKIPGVQFTEKHMPFFSGMDGEEFHAHFIFKGREFTIDVPFADFWVGPKDPPQYFPEICEIYDYIEHHAISKLRRKLMDIVTLDFKSAFAKRK